MFTEDPLSDSDQGILYKESRQLLKGFGAVLVKSGQGQVQASIYLATNHQLSNVQCFLSTAPHDFL